MPPESSFINQFDLEKSLRSEHAAPDKSSTDVSQRLFREAEMIGLGVGGAVGDTLRHPLSKLPELSSSLAVGTALGGIARLGAPGRVIAAGVGGAMLVKFAVDELTGSRWSKFGAAVSDTWRSGENRDKNIEITRNSLGSFVVDTAVASAGMKVGSWATAAFAPKAKLLDTAINRSARDNGAALLSLQNRFENPAVFQRQAAGQIELITHSVPAVPGMPRGDLIRVARTPDDNILLAAMDVEGHGINAAKKAVTVHSAIDQVLPSTSNKTASEILGQIDEKLSSADELSITAALMHYNPRTRTLQTATASSEFAFLIRGNGTVHQLDAKVGGLALGADMYGLAAGGNEIVQLAPKDTVVMASDGVFDRFGYGNAQAFAAFLQKIGPNPQRIRRAILETPPPETGVDDSSFVIFRPL
ncbi:MAG: serine/threonine-protein phosphatase [Cyanobacteria bacterium SZAS TMP-1]|nr:serine/threonine-protein phosphatase [Cyanobacteria bacterium SZAS TMP-1]